MRVIATHILTYWLAGSISHWLITHKYYVGAQAVASILLIVGSVAGISGIESCVFTKVSNPALWFVTLPETILQTLFFGYIIMYWEPEVVRLPQRNREAVGEKAAHPIQPVHSRYESVIRSSGMKNRSCY
jgi:hypothetical protein